MHTMFTTLRRLLAWLNEVQDGSEPLVGLRDWADRPSHHPCA
ncbi:hypothetical protein [Devosia sp. 66-22]|nr:hypothetical protein [Devosia sp. 66-22]